MTTTAIGIGIAVPHEKLPPDMPSALALGGSPEGIDFGSLDEQPVQLMVIIAQLVGAKEEYLRILSRIGILLQEPKQLQRCGGRG